MLFALKFYRRTTVWKYYCNFEHSSCSAPNDPNKLSGHMPCPVFRSFRTWWNLSIANHPKSALEFPFTSLVKLIFSGFLQISRYTFSPPLKTHKTLTWTNCSSASRTIDVTSAERDPSTCALTSASGRSLQYNDRKKRTKKPKMKVFRNLRHATHSQYKLWWSPILTRESDLSNRCGIAHYGYISAWNMMNNYKQQHEREQQRTEQEWNMNDQRLQDRKGKSIDSYADYRLQFAVYNSRGTCNTS